MIGDLKGLITCQDAIKIEQLEEHLRGKFASPTNYSDFIKNAEIAVNKRYSEILHDDIPMLISASRIIRLINDLKRDFLQAKTKSLWNI